jgi:hypothetical protein
VRAHCLLRRQYLYFLYQYVSTFVPVSEYFCTYVDALEQEVLVYVVHEASTFVPGSKYFCTCIDALEQEVLVYVVNICLVLAENDSGRRSLLETLKQIHYEYVSIRQLTSAYLSTAYVSIPGDTPADTL